MRVGRVARLVVAVFGAELPHPGVVLDGVVGVREGVIVNGRESGEEGGPCCGDVVGEGEAGFWSDGGERAAIVGSGNGGAVLGFEDVAEGKDGAEEAVVLVKRKGS